MADTALAAELLGVDDRTFLAANPGRANQAGALLGLLFESLVAQSLRVYAQACEASVGHLRQWGGEREVDLVVTARDGRCVAIEVKLSPQVSDNDVRHLHWLRDEMGDELADALIVTTGQHAYRRSDGIAVVPAALLGP